MTQIDTSAYLLLVHALPTLPQPTSAVVIFRPKCKCFAIKNEFSARSIEPSTNASQAVAKIKHTPDRQIRRPIRTKRLRNDKACRAVLAIMRVSTTKWITTFFFCGQTNETIVIMAYSGFGNIILWKTSDYGYKNKIGNLLKANIQMLGIVWSLFSDQA